MYDISIISGLQRLITSQLQRHTKDLKEGKSKSQFNPTPDAVPKIFDRNGMLFIPELVEIWTKLNTNCRDHQPSSAIYRKIEVKRAVSHFKVKVVHKTQMNDGFIAILQSLLDLSTTITNRVCMERIRLLEEDESFLKSMEYNTGKCLDFLRLQTQRRALRRTKDPEELNDDEKVKLLSITTELFKYGVATDYYHAHTTSSISRSP